MYFLGAYIALTSMLAAQGQTPVVLESPHVRIELESRTFSVRFVGFPGGKNFLDLIHLTASAIASPGWLEPGGITTDLIPDSENSALLRRGPAELVVFEEHYVLLLGPEDPDHHWRIKKEYFLAVDRSEVRYKLTVMSTLKEERKVGVRITAQLPREGGLLIPKAAGALGLLRGDFPRFNELIGSVADAYTINLAVGPKRQRAVLASPATSLVYETPFGRWERQIEIRSSLESPSENAMPRLLVLLDDDSHVYQAGLEVTQSGVNVGAPLVVQERWRFTPPGTSSSQDG